ncbi:MULTISPECIES: hypothetical protein [Aeromonas]
MGAILMQKILFLFVCMLSLAGCAQIQHYKDYSKAFHQPQTVYVGGEIYAVNKTRDLPNVFGKADIYGGKVQEGMSELRFMGFDSDGMAVLRFTDVKIQSNESVFTRYGRNSVVANTNSFSTLNVNNYSAVGTTNSNTVVTQYQKPEAQIYALPPNTAEFKFNPADKKLKMDGVTIEIIEVGSNSMSYRLSES